MTEQTPQSPPSAPNSGNVRRFRIDERLAGKRLDAALADLLNESRAQARRLLERGGVTLDGHAMRPNEKGKLLTLGQRLEVTGYLSREEERALATPDAPLRIVAEGEGWVVVDKPAGVPVHPLEPTETGSVLNALIARHPQMHGVGEGGLRSGVVHRLDLETSGVLIFATTQPAWQALREVFRKHTTRKTYQAIVLGYPTREGNIALDLVVAQHRPAKVAVVTTDAADREKPRDIRRCDLRWRVVEKLRNASLIEIDLGTGFLHQIRVMMSHTGHPVAGDAWYASSRVVDSTGATRPMLHAARLDIRELNISSACDPPADFQACLASLKVPRT